MCDFITAVLPARARVAELTPIFAAHERALKPLENPSIQRQLQSGELYFKTAPGHCDCETVLGSAEPLGPSRADTRLERELHKRRQQGWSAAKIDSWLRQRETSKDRKASPRLEELAQWTGLFEAIRASGATPYVGLLIHEYHGLLSEEIRLLSREHVNIAELTGEVLTAMQRDVLYEFRA